MSIEDVFYKFWRDMVLGEMEELDSYMYLFDEILSLG